MDKEERKQRLEQMRTNIRKGDPSRVEKPIQISEYKSKKASSGKKQYKESKKSKNKMKKIAALMVAGVLGLGVITGIATFANNLNLKHTIEFVNNNYEDLLDASLDEENEQNLKDLLATIQEYKKIGILGNRDEQALKIKGYSGLIETVTMSTIKEKISEALGVDSSNVILNVYYDSNAGPITSASVNINGIKTSFGQESIISLFEKNVYPSEISTAMVDVGEVQRYNQGKMKDISVDRLVGMVDASKAIALNKYDYKNDKIVKIGKIEMPENDKIANTEEIETTEPERE